MKKPNYKKAKAELAKLGVPTYQRFDMQNFGISAEHPDSDNWVRFYDSPPDWDFGVHPTIDNILRKHGLFCEWINGGELGVYAI
jgi:hypothetical protein